MFRANLMNEKYRVLIFKDLFISSGGFRNDKRRILYTALVEAN